MADRIFASIFLIVTLAYAYIAFTQISAPFQYDPLGPESWPRLLSILAIFCLIYVLWKPDVDHFDMPQGNWLKIGVVIVLLFAYAYLFQPFGFIISTFLFGTIMARFLGANWVKGVIFGAGVGVLGYFLCAGLLDLNLPAGPLPRI